MLVIEADDILALQSIRSLRIGAFERSKQHGTEMRGALSSRAIDFLPPLDVVVIDFERAFDAGCIAAQIWQVAWQELPASCQELLASCQELLASYPELPGSCQELPGCCQELPGSCQELPASYRGFPAARQAAETELPRLTYLPSLFAPP